MRYGLFTISRRDIEDFKELLPDYVFANCKNKGIFMLGATDEEMRLMGLTQFFVGMLENGEAIADIVYVYVFDEYRKLGVASRMIREVHKIMKKSGGEKCFAFLEKKQSEQQVFKLNGYIFMKPEKDMIGYINEVHENIVPDYTDQGVYYVNR